jgi:hypothetical protein
MSKLAISGLVLPRAHDPVYNNKTFNTKHSLAASMLDQHSPVPPLLSAYRLIPCALHRELVTQVNNAGPSTHGVSMASHLCTSGNCQPPIGLQAAPVHSRLLLLYRR